MNQHKFNQCEFSRSIFLIKIKDFLSEPTGQTEWFHSARPAQFDSEIEMLCSGAFGGENMYVSNLDETT